MKTSPTTTRPHLALVTCHPGAIGGMEKFTRFLVDAALTANWRVTVALSGEDIFEEAHRDFGSTFSVRRVDWLDASFKGDRTFQWSRIAHRRAWFRRVRPDVALFVQSSNTPFRAAVAGARLAHVPCVLTHRTMPYVIGHVPPRRHCFGLLPGLGLYRRKQVLKTRLVGALAARIVYNSERVRGDYERDYGYAPHKGLVIPNAVDAPEMPAPSGRSLRPVIIGYIGRLAIEKRLDILLKAFAMLDTSRAVRLVIWGDGPERFALSRLAAELNIADRLDWCGPLDDVGAAYQACDIVTLCSPRESSSNMLLEAMAAGRAVIAPDVGGQPELVRHGTCGLIVPPLDVPALRAALESLVHNDVKRLCLGVRARAAVAADHDPRAIARAWMETLEVAANTAPADRRLRARWLRDWSKELVPVDLPRM